MNVPVDVKKKIDAAKREIMAAERAEAEASIREAEVARSEYAASKMKVIVSAVKAILESHDFGVARNDANVDMISRWLFDNKRPAMVEDVIAAVQRLSLSPTPPLSDQEERDQIESEISRLKADVKIPADWSEHDKKMKLASIQLAQEADHNRFASKIGDRWLISTQQMRKERDDIVNGRALRKLDHGQLKAEVRQEREAPATATVPQVPPGTPILEPHIGRYDLLQYKPDRLRRLIFIFDQRHGVGSGQKAVDARLSGADRDELSKYEAGF